MNVIASVWGISLALDYDIKVVPHTAMVKVILGITTSHHAGIGRMVVYFLQPL